MAISTQVIRDSLQTKEKKRIEDEKNDHTATERWLETLEKPQFNRTSVS